MKRRFLILVFGWLALLSAQSFGSGTSGIPESDVLSPSEAATLSYIWELHKYQRDRYEGSAGCWDIPTLIPMAYDEELQMDILGTLLGQYDVPFPSNPDEKYGYSEGFLTEPFDIMFYTCWAMPPLVHQQSAYIEEIEIRDLRQAITETDEQPIIDAYTGALVSAYDHLLQMASIQGDPTDYVAQVLSQEDVDEILSGDATWPHEPFEINAGLNDTWHYPGTMGQGFFISVYPDCDTVMVGWLTFDTELPDERVTAKLGDPGQRWLTAQGSYTGNRAELTVYSSSGGLFNMSPPTVQNEPIGSLELQFEDCSTGSITYSLPGINEFGSISIQRIAPDNVAACESHIQQSK